MNAVAVVQYLHRCASGVLPAHPFPLYAGCGAVQLWPMFGQLRWMLAWLRAQLEHEGVPPPRVDWVWRSWRGLCATGPSAAINGLGRAVFDKFCTTVALPDTDREIVMPIDPNDRDWVEGIVRNLSDWLWTACKFPSTVVQFEAALVAHLNFRAPSPTPTHYAASPLQCCSCFDDLLHGTQVITFRDILPAHGAAMRCKCRHAELICLPCFARMYYHFCCARASYVAATTGDTPSDESTPPQLITPVCRQPFGIDDLRPVIVSLSPLPNTT